MKRQQKMGVLSALVILAMSSFGMSQMAQAAGVDPSNTNPVTGEEVYAYLHDPKLDLGFDNTASGDVYSVYGYMNIVNDYGTAIGFMNNYDAGTAGEMSQAIGFLNTATGEGSTANGYANAATGDYATAVGAANDASGKYAVAVGTANAASAENAMAFGNENIVTAEKGMAFGYKSYVAASGAVAIGNEAVNTEEGTVSFGHKKGEFTGLYSYTDDQGNTYYSSTKSERYNTPVNYDSDQFARLTNVAAGKDTHDVATYGQLIGKASYDVATGVLTLTKNDSTLDAITVTIPSSVADVGDTKKLSAAGLGDNVVDSVLSVNDRVDTLSDDINKVGAGAAALAALHPEGFDPADKWSFAVGYGHYKSANAGALGAFYKPNFDTTLSVGGTIGNGNSMLNAGVSFKLGQRGARLSQNASNQQLVQEMQSLRMNNDRLLAQNEEQQKEISAQAQEIRELKAQMARVLAKLGE